MFKRVERKRKRLDEAEELGLDGDAKEIMGLNDTDSDESESDSDSGSDIGEAQKVEDAADDNDAPISIEEVLKDTIYLISLDPTVYGCVLCKGKFIKNAGMAAAHKNANVHKRRFEHFKLLSADADPHSNAWGLVGAIQSHMQKLEPPALSKRALKRQGKQAVICETRRRHKELKAKAMAKRASKKLSVAEEKKPASPESQNQRGRTRKKQKLESKTVGSRTRDVGVNSTSRTKTPSDSKKSIIKSRIKSTRKASKSS